MQPKRRVYQVRYFSTRQRRRGRGSPAQIVALRLCDLARLFRSRYGAVTLPNDDSGRDDAELAAHHLAGLAYPNGRIMRWLALWAPWLTLAEQQEIIKGAVTNRKHWTADQLAWRLRLTIEERTMLGITTIGAVDRGKAARTKRRKERERQRKIAKRRASGCKTRAEYEAAALTRTKPWIAEGISRASWYRRKVINETETGPVTA